MGALDFASPESVVSTAELNQRQSRPPDYAAESRALVSLAQEITHSPKGILQRLAEVALSLCRAHSAGISPLVSDQGCRISSQRQHELAMGKIGLGVRGMQERVRQLGGRLELNSNGKGTHVSAVFPVERRAARGTSSPYYSR